MSTNDASTEKVPDPAIAERYAGRVIDIEEIMTILPHRPPFLFLDRVIELEPMVRAVGLKAVTINEPFFQGHYPGHPVMPGVLIVEALAQVNGVLVLTGLDPKGRQPYFTGIKDARFRRPVRPGDVLRLEVDMKRHTLRFGNLLCRMEARAFVDDELAAEAECSFGLIHTD